MISKLVFLIFVAASSLGAPTNVAPLEKQQPTVIPIVSQSEELDANGTFKFSYETANGIKREETSFDKVIPKTSSRNANSKEEEEESDNNDEIHVQQGSYSYTAPDGTIITLRYIADENGFQPMGNHLPRAPAPAQISSSSSKMSGRALKLLDNSESASSQTTAIKLPSEKQVHTVGDVLESSEFTSLATTEIMTISSSQPQDFDEATTEYSSRKLGNTKSVAILSSADTDQNSKTNTTTIPPSKQGTEVSNVSESNTKSDVSDSFKKISHSSEISTTTEETQPIKDLSKFEESLTQAISEDQTNGMLSFSETTSATPVEKTLELSTTRPTSAPAGTNETTLKSNVTSDNNVEGKSSYGDTKTILKSTDEAVKKSTEQSVSTPAPSNDDVSTSASSA